MFAKDVFDSLTDPGWAPALVGGDALVVYLDQWCFDHLVRDRSDQPVSDDESGLFEQFHAWAKRGLVAFPLGETHYRENWNRKNSEARWDTAAVMGLLSGFNTVGVSHLTRWDARIGLGRYLDSNYTEAVPEVFGWGAMHCLRSVPAASLISNSVTELNADPTTSLMAPEDQRLMRYRVELEILGLGGPGVPPGPDLLPIPDPDGPKFAIGEAEIRSSIVKHGRSARVVRNALRLLSIRDTMDLLAEAEKALELPVNGVLESIAELEPEQRSSKLDQLIAGMPIQGTFTSLRIEAHLIESWVASSSDLRDYMSMATMLPFVDLFVADKKTFNLAQKALGSESRPKVVRRLVDVATWIEGRLA